MRKFTVLFAMALAVFAGTAYANFCARDVVPAATLLVPYAAVGHTGGIPDANKGTTIFSITNVSSAATIVHVTLWDAKSDPGIDFDVILSGYDTWQINFRDAMLGRFDLFDTDDAAIAALAAPSYFQPFEWGPDGLDSNQPLTGWPTNDHEAQGALPLPQNRNVITSCPTAPPYGNLSGLSSQIINKFIDVLVPHNHAGCTVGTTTTLPRTDKTSWTTILGNDPIVFYVTADVTGTCSTLFPSNANYWTTVNVPAGSAYRNVLIGDVIYLDAFNGYSEMMAAVHIEADNDWADALRTFYGRYNNTVFNAGPDFREPLATAFAFRYADEVAAGISSNVLVWKNKTEFTATPAVNDCLRYLYYAWDASEHSLSRTGTTGPSGFPITGLDPNQFPFETQSVALTATQFDLYPNIIGLDTTRPSSVNDIGWMLLVFPPSYSALNPNDDTDTDSADTQAWVGLTFKYNIGGKQYSAGMEAATMANAHCFLQQRLPALGIDFEYGAFTGTGPVE